MSSTRFQVRSSVGGGALALSVSGLSGNGHVFAFEGIDLKATGTGRSSYDRHHLRWQRALRRVGGAAALAGAPTGDGQTVASTTGAGGGFIEVGNAKATASSTYWIDDNDNAVVDAGETRTPSVNITIASGADLRAAMLEVYTDAWLDVYATADGDGIGFVSLGKAEAYTTVVNQSTVTISAGATLTSTGALSVRATTHGKAGATASSDKIGLGSGVTIRARADADWTSVVVVNGTLTAATTLDIDAQTIVDAEVSAKADADGFGADGDANDTDGQGARIGLNGSRTAVDIGATARLRGATLDLEADTSGRAHAYGETDSDALGADADARADAIARGLTEVIVRGAAQLTGTSLVKLTAEQSKLEVTAHSSADCDCLGGDTDSNATDDAQTTSRITGQKDAFIWTADLKVFAKATGTISHPQRLDRAVASSCSAARAAARRTASSATSTGSRR